jgi:hypothetical protein
MHLHVLLVKLRPGAINMLMKQHGYCCNLRMPLQSTERALVLSFPGCLFGPTAASNRVSPHNARSWRARLLHNIVRPLTSFFSPPTPYTLFSAQGTRTPVHCCSSHIHCFTLSAHRQHCLTMKVFHLAALFGGALSAVQPIVGRDGECLHGLAFLTLSWLTRCRRHHYHCSLRYINIHHH